MNTDNTTPTYDADYFIAKFSAIPEEKWTTGRYRRTMGAQEVCCALGHCGVHSSTDRFEGEAAALTTLFRTYDLEVVGVNDGEMFLFNQKKPTPKQRILAALDYIKQRQTNKS